MLHSGQAMKRLFQNANAWIAALLVLTLPLGAEAKGRSGGSRSSSSSSHSYSSSRSSSGSSRSYSSGSGKSYSSSGSGKSYSSGSLWSDSNRHGYGSGSSYASGSGRLFSSGSSKDGAPAKSTSAASKAPSSSGFSFDNAAARAKKEEVSRNQYNQFKQSQGGTATASSSDRSGVYVRPPSIPSTSQTTYRPRLYVPNTIILSQRPARLYGVFSPYWYRPVVVYNDPYGSLFWWWLLDQSIDDRAWWAYHHRYDMDSARYQALMASDQQLQARVAQLEAQQVARDPNYTPRKVDQDLMYSDQAVARAQANRPTTMGVITFWVFAVPMALGVCAVFIWLIWFKRWKTA